MGKWLDGIPGLDEAVWQKRNAGLSKRMEEYCDDYRQGRCLKCTDSMKEKRCCRKYPSGRTYCDSMIQSRTRKFRDTIMAEVTLLMRIRQDIIKSYTPEKSWGGKDDGQTFGGIFRSREP